MGFMDKLKSLFGFGTEETTQPEQAPVATKVEEKVTSNYVSPMTGEIVNVFPTKHAIGIMSAEGKEILIHFGLETVKLNGEGFEAHVATGDKVTKGQKLLTVDLPYITENAKATITPVVFTNLDGKAVTVNATGNVTAGEPLDIQIG